MSSVIQYNEYYLFLLVCPSHGSCRSVMAETLSHLRSWTVSTETQCHAIVVGKSFYFGCEKVYHWLRKNSSWLVGYLSSRNKDSHESSKIISICKETGVSTDSTKEVGQSLVSLSSHYPLPDFYLMIVVPLSYYVGAIVYHSLWGGLKLVFLSPAKILFCSKYFSKVWREMLATILLSRWKPRLEYWNWVPTGKSGLAKVIYYHTSSVVLGRGPG